ncbi:Membrane protein involved in the export of O-antigen and teichoic acid [Parapedobacter composti]|uniref:Membrane protein involved in the export of O-antigen and teichoic acid n=1 Tax=Parapedobacter composti TaxID=623281 RepID=A0A1I1FXP8_9SPHI|nr:polysaccharide biosynthesis C-terminal domain-containing protein [Parapedobacter composti]SFC01823.1 Membrane protein involved in the export of O-antigen and teichoic acid [Parapedobacter composti]
MSVLRNFAGQTAIYGLSTIVARLINFVLTPLFVDRFSPAVYGIFNNMYSWAAMLSAVLAFGMETTYFRYLQKHEGNRAQVYNNSFVIILFTSAVFIITVHLFSGGIATWLNNGYYDADYNRYVRYFAWILVADALAVIPFARLRAEGRPVRFALLKLVNILTFVGLNLLFIVAIPWLLEQGAVGSAGIATWYREGWVGYVFLSNLAASGLTLLLLLPEIAKLKLRLDRKLAKDMITYSFPVLVANISFIINEHVDKILIPKLLPGGVGARDLGIYGAVSKIAVFLSIGVQAFRLGAEPFFFSYAKNENARTIYALIMDYFVIAMVLVMVGITVNIEWLKYFIEGGSPAEQAAYWSGLPIVPVLLLNYVLLGIYMNLSIWYKLSDQTRFALYISGIGAVITLVLNVVFIPQYSYVASAWATLLAYGSMVLISYLWGQRHYPIPYRVGKNGGYILAGIVVCWLAFDVFDRHLIIGNLLFVVFAGATLLIERKTLLALLRKD